MRGSVVSVLYFALTLVCISQGRTERDAGNAPEHLRLFKERSERILAMYDTVRSPDYYACAVQYARGTSPGIADERALRLLAEPTGDVFWMLNATALAMHGRFRMSRHVQAEIRRAWRTYTPYRGDTENHWCAYYASMFIMSEQWPDLPGSEWFNGKSSEENRREARSYLLRWMASTVTDGQMEFDSPTYLPVFLGAMILLNDFASDPVIRKGARMMSDLLLADFAADHLQGQYCGAHSRVQESIMRDPESTPASGLSWLYFGADGRSRTQTEVLCALSTYRLPEVIYRMANDRRSATIQRERKRVRTILRFGAERNPAVYKYRYMTDRYAIGSVQGDLLSPIQQQSWSVNVAGTEPMTIGGLHPSWSERELGMFFPEETRTLMAQVVAAKGMYNNPDKRTGGSAFERILQDRNTLIALYDLPEDAMAGHVDGYLPRAADTIFRSPSGWYVLRAGDVYAGWYPLTTVEEIDRGDAICLRSADRTTGYVVEVRSAAEAASFDMFTADLAKHLPVFTTVAGRPAVRYVTIDGRKIEFEWGGKRYLNSREIAFSKELFAGPFLSSGAKEHGIIRMNVEGRRVKYDFRFILKASMEAGQ